MRPVAAGAFFCQLSDHFRGGQAVKPEFSLVDFVDALDQQLFGGLLQHDSAATLLHCFDEIFPRASASVSMITRVLNFASWIAANTR